MAGRGDLTDCYRSTRRRALRVVRHRQIVLVVVDVASHEDAGWREDDW
ncbi:hypothetical protein [Parafrankia sp. BMG5.11]|nr:hypothetical protein [Parafrankia sp. BMG5.11]